MLFTFMTNSAVAVVCELLSLARLLWLYILFVFVLLSINKSIIKLYIYESNEIKIFVLDQFMIDTGIATAVKILICF